MAAQTLVPNSLLASTGLSSPTVADLQAQDANWSTATSNNVDTSVQVSYPTPPGNPTAGAGLQTITVQTRKNAASGSGTPTITIGVGIVGGLPQLSSASFNVTSTTGQVDQFTFDYAAVTGAAADGSNIQVWVNTTRSGGSPSFRSSVDIGYVGWDVIYSVGTVYNQAASITSTPTMELVRQSAKSYGVTSTPVALLLRSVSKAWAIVSTPVATLIRSAAKTATIASTGVASFLKWASMGWVFANSETSAVQVRVGFPTPPDNPNGTQTITVQARKRGSGADPTYYKEVL
jgi:hypothetical protein